MQDEDEPTIYLARFCAAEIFRIPEQEAIGLRLLHFKGGETDPSERVRGPWYQLSRHDIQDLIGHLQHVLAQIDSPTAPARPGAPRH
jgi:hypothetical protein